MNSDLCIEFANVSFCYPDKPFKKILSNISFKLKKREILAILGPNGVGKTTIMNMIADFLKPSLGRIIRNAPLPKEIFSTIIPQEYSLLDWKTVSNNIGLSLLQKSISEKQAQRIIDNQLRALKIAPYKDMLPAKLSGGIKQRVAIARALAPNPQLLLLDEPFNSLDISTRHGLIKDIKNIIKKHNKSAIIVTHDIDEAVSLADRILIIDKSTKKARTVMNNNYDLSRSNETKERIRSFLV